MNQCFGFHKRIQLVLNYQKGNKTKICTLKKWIRNNNSDKFNLMSNTQI